MDATISTVSSADYCLLVALGRGKRAAHPKQSRLLHSKKTRLRHLDTNSPPPPPVMSLNGMCALKRHIYDTSPSIYSLSPQNPLSKIVETYMHTIIPIAARAATYQQEGREGGEKHYIYTFRKESICLVFFLKKKEIFLSPTLASMLLPSSMNQKRIIHNSRQLR